MNEHLLVADDESNLRKVLGALLRRQGYRVTTVSDGEEALLKLSETHFNAVITDLRMPRLDGMSLLKKIQERSSDLPVIIITAHGTVDTAVEALKLGAFDFITKPYDRDELKRVVRKALAIHRLDQVETQGHKSQKLPGRFGLIGDSPPMRRIFQIVDKIARSPSTVLISGESGTGKELIARALHYESDRAERPFIRVNCAAIPVNLMEAEFFGYERGAFTGAVTSKPGRFELAHRGSLFLDEIGEISTEMQVKLLRAIQEGEFERVGGLSTRRVELRLITATNRNLLEEIRRGNFREDLYYRLNVVPISLPPLRERLGDIPLLVRHLLEKYSRRLKREVLGIEEEAMGKLLTYAWPGNIRELENVIERGILFSEGQQICVQDLPSEIRGLSPTQTSSEGLGLKEVVRMNTQRIEREMIERALEATGRNVTRTAKRLSISRKSLQTKMKELGLREPN